MEGASRSRPHRLQRIFQGRGQDKELLDRPHQLAVFGKWGEKVAKRRQPGSARIVLIEEIFPMLAANFVCLF
jgi:hypothetical protein